MEEKGPQRARLLAGQVSSRAAGYSPVLTPPQAGGEGGSGERLSVQMKLWSGAGISNGGMVRL